MAELAPKVSAAFELIADRSRDNRLVFFLGSGASLHEPEASSTGSTDRIPSVRELTQYLAADAEIALPSQWPVSLIELATLYEQYFTRQELAKRLTRIFTTEYAPGRLHRYLARFPGSPLIITTNYDRFIERAFDATGRPYQLVVNTLAKSRRDSAQFLWVEPGDRRPRVLQHDQFPRVPLDSIPTIFKMHGSVGLLPPHDDTFVITEDDYYEMAGREHTDRLVPIPVRARLSSTTIVFLGYSVGDIHVRYALAPTYYQSKVTQFAFNKHVSLLDRYRLERRGMKVFELDTDAFVDALERVLNLPPPEVSPPRP